MTWLGTTLATNPQHPESSARSVRSSSQFDQQFGERVGLGALLPSLDVGSVTSRPPGSSRSAPVVISDVTSGAAYKHADGFDEVYGDYGEIAITSAGKAIATWGEGLSWVGPGGVWFNRQN